jgi:DNA-binding GntR family transcriptional regulator
VLVERFLEQGFNEVRLRFDEIPEWEPDVDLDADLTLPDRASTAERVADVLRTRIIEGLIPPGTRLSEDQLVTALGVSRNTLREAFRLLSHERLTVHKMNRGVFVRMLSVADVIDVYRVRRIIECAAVRSLREVDDAAIAAVLRGVEEGEQAAAADDWRAVGTADLRFHQAIAALAGSQRVDELARGMLAELRLVFHVMGERPKEFHEPYLVRNREIAALIRDRSGRGAERALREYLDMAEQQLSAAYEERVEGAPRQPAAVR